MPVVVIHINSTIDAGVPALGLHGQIGQSVECRHKTFLIERFLALEDVKDFGGDDTAYQAFGIVGGKPRR